jgi:DNA polymerase III sliding clamp (beta) subunit (PCNA family)
MTESVEEEPLLIPAKSMAQVIRYPLSHISAGDSWVHFKTTEDTIISCRIFGNDNYNDLDLVIEQAGQGLVINLPDNMSEALSKTEIFAKNDEGATENVTLDLKNNKLIVSASDDIDWIQEEVDVFYDSTPVKFSINPLFLKDILPKKNEFTINERLIKFEGDNWVHVAALIRDSYEVELPEAPEPVEDSEPAKRRTPKDIIPEKSQVTKMGKTTTEDDITY